MKTAALVLLSLAAPACYSVDTIDPGPVVIDDFDDGDFVPTMSELDYWQCYSFNPSTNLNFSCDKAPGYQSKFSLYVEFTLDDPPDGVQQYPGAGLGAWANGSTVDFTRYHELDISLKLQNGSPPLPSEALVYIELDCKNAPGEDGKPSNFYVTLSVKPTMDWSTFPLALSNWASPPWESAHVKGGIPACMRAIDGISISLSGQLQDGESAQGKLFIDGLKLK
ncbi:MAG TPA: hypothetical protein VKQ32_06140 [Polyangia bacterium]|nr:hypothetical protein [Polyangia bacterium]